MSKTITLPAELVTKGVAFGLCRSPKYLNNRCDFIWPCMTMHYIQLLLRLFWTCWHSSPMLILEHHLLLGHKHPIIPSPCLQCRRGDRWVWAAAWTMWTKMSTTGSPNRFESGDANPGNRWETHMGFSEDFHGKHGEKTWKKPWFFSHRPLVHPYVLTEELLKMGLPGTLVWSVQVRFWLSCWQLTWWSVGANAFHDIPTPSDCLTINEWF